MDRLPAFVDVLVNTFSTLINQFIEFVPRILGAGFILLIGFGVAKAVSLVLRRVLVKVGFDRIGDKLNEIDFIKRLSTGIKLSDIATRVLYYFILLVFLMAATETLGVSAITDMVKSLVAFIPRLIAAAIMLQVGVLIADALRGAVVTLCQSFNIASGKLLGMIVFFFFLVVTLISALGQAGINTELLESSFNLLVGGVIFAFAAGYSYASRDIMANILSSLYSKSRFKEGQTIRIGAIEGTIVKIDSTSMTLQTGETVTIVPLQALQTQVVEVL
ncbi:mechanosensitive ion channel family protein [Tellurirhabdus rosea]|uniref:mechanosensitive ion channel family protein n=1 Tax=Tellurirhabdus rosea TaxID=2674997 RepID=UPI002255A841|nr:mechanosensitive ion channel [Tellurirhabdus rosea]